MLLASLALLQGKEKLLPLPCAVHSTCSIKWVLVRQGHPSLIKSDLLPSPVHVGQGERALFISKIYYSTSNVFQMSSYISVLHIYYQRNSPFYGEYPHSVLLVPQETCHEAADLCAHRKNVTQSSSVVNPSTLNIVELILHAVFPWTILIQSIIKKSLGS